jgi:predicted GIY-YIG superfamily endonuclease
MHYFVYILESIQFPDKIYIGFTKDLKERLNKHSEGGSRYTTQFKPWKYRTTVSFDSKAKALAFERYLKSHSGRAFAKKHF